MNHRVTESRREARCLRASVVLAALLVIQLISFARAQTFARAYGGASAENALCIHQTSDGGYIVAGGVSGDMLVLKLDASGNITWQKSYATTVSEYAQSIQQTLDGGYIVAGNRRTSGSFGKTHIWLLRLDSSGNVTWNNLYSAATNDFVNSVQETLDGGFIVGGYTSDPDGWIFKVDSLGAVVFWKKYGGASTDQIASVRETSDGGYVAVGFSNSFSASQDALILKLDSSGNVTWAKTYGGANDEEALSIQQATDGGFVAAGYLLTNLGFQDLWVFKVNSSGALVWQKSYGGDLDDSANAIALTSDGGYLVAGITNSFASQNQGWILRLNNGGDLSWQNTYGAATVLTGAGEGLSFIQQTADDGVIAAGTTDSYGSGSGDFWVLKTDSLGAVDATCDFISTPAVNSQDTSIAAASQTITPASLTPALTVLTPTVTTATASVTEQCGNCGKDSYEPDDDAFTATAVLHGGESQAHNFCDADTDWVSFSACAGRTYTIQTSNLGSSADTTLQLYKQDGTTLIASDDNGAGGLASKIVWSAPSEGTVHVKILQTDGRNEKNRDYTISLTGNTGGCSSWGRNHGGNAADSSFAALQNPDGGFTATGSTASFGAGSNDVWIVKVDSGGTLVSQKTYGGTGDDTAKAVQRTFGGGMVVAGASNSTPATGHDAWILNLNSAGAISWQKIYGGSLEDEALAIRQTSDGGFIVAGDTTSFGAGMEDFYVVRLDSLGNTVWSKSYGGSASDVANSVIQTTDGGFVVAGYTASSGAGAKDFWIMRLDTGGKVSWQKTYGGTGDDIAYSIQQTSDGGFLVAGSLTGASVDALVLRLDPEGAVLWKKTYGGANTDSAQSIQQTTDGGFVFAGKTATQGAGMNDVWVVRGTAQGAITWQKAFGGSNDESAAAIQQIADGGFFVSGSTATFHAGANDYWLLKLDANGSVTASCANAATTTLTAAASTASVNFSSSVSPAAAITVTNTSVAGVSTAATSTTQCLQHLPLEVSPPAAAQPLRFTSKTAMQWESAANNLATTFDVYSGTTSDFASGNFGTCLQSSIGTNSTTLADGNPAAGACKYYLVTGKNVLGEGPLGNSSNGNARANNTPCP